MKGRQLRSPLELVTPPEAGRNPERMGRHATMQASAAEQSLLGAVRVDQLRAGLRREGVSVEDDRAAVASVLD
jgi:hypothetical protein